MGWCVGRFHWLKFARFSRLHDFLGVTGVTGVTDSKLFNTGAGFKGFDACNTIYSLGVTGVTAM